MTRASHHEGRNIYLVYNTALLLLSPLFALLLALRLARGKSRPGWSERWGHFSVPPPDGRRRVWFHAASVGEVMAATPIMQAYAKVRPEDEMVMSVITPGGHEVGGSQLGKTLAHLFYAPFDVPFAVRRAVRAVRPDVFVDLETELWPNLLYHVRRSGARSLLVNARISDRSLPSYLRLRPLFRWVLAQFDRLMAQTKPDAERLIAIGALPARVEVAGNAKFDQAAAKLDLSEVEKLRTEFRLNPDAPVLVVGSTRQPDEERLVLEAYQAARRDLPDLALIHAPRHVERAGEVMELMREAGLAPARRTELGGKSEPAEQIVLDTFGELGRVYALADVAFIGNSLTEPGGGQNPLQPFAQGKPVVYGPYMQNFRDIAGMAENAGVAYRVTDAEELAARIVQLVRKPDEGLPEMAVELVQSNRGAAERYARAIAELVEAGDTGANS